jgi:hypothetical protein
MAASTAFQSRSARKRRPVGPVGDIGLVFDHLVGGDRKRLRPAVHWPTLIMLTTVVISSKALL